MRLGEYAEGAGGIAEAKAKMAQEKVEVEKVATEAMKVGDRWVY